MKLYVCWNASAGPMGIHPCGTAFEALEAAGYAPEVVVVKGLRYFPGWLNDRFAGRREVYRLTGSRSVPVLVTDAGEVVAESQRIIAWAAEHAAGGG